MTAGRESGVILFVLLGFVFLNYNRSELHYKNLEIARKAAHSEKRQCDLCKEWFWPAGLSRHRKLCVNRNNCPVCGIRLKNNINVTCSKGCSNTYFRSGENNGNYNPESSYREICFAHHERKCVHCGEELVVAVHHLDHDNTNNDPANLIPLCPNHHQYWHSKYRYIVEPSVRKYIADWKKSRM